MEKPEVSQPLADPYRRVLGKAISQYLLENGIHAVESDCLEALIEMHESLLIEIAQSARSYYELAGRTMPVVGDVLLTFANMGLALNGLEEFAKREDRGLITIPPQMSQQRQLNLLQAGTKAPHPPHVPNYLPPLPDPHAYIRTPTHKQPVTEYEAIREKAANQKRDIEKALTKFLCKTSDTDSLFETEDNMFPLIACKPAFPPYLAALNPTDQVFDFEELEYHYLVANRTEDVTSKDDNDENDSDNEDNVDGDKSKEDNKPELEIKPNSSTNKAILENPNIDNPYLRAATLPKRSKINTSANLLPPIKPATPTAVLASTPPPLPTPPPPPLLLPLTETKTEIITN